jgi:translin
MINSKLLKSLKEDYRQNESERRQIISAANNILFLSKKVIFKLQREETKEAEKQIKEIELLLKNLEERFGVLRLRKEGAYKAAAEEYMEGKIFFQALNAKEITPVTDIDMDYEAYLGGICDMIGELVRYATNQAAKGKFGKVSKIKNKADDIMSELIDFDMTGYLRTKYDQARGHLRKLEQMTYEIKLKTGK